MCSIPMCNIWSISAWSTSLWSFFPLLSPGLCHPSKDSRAEAHPEGRLPGDSGLCVCKYHHWWSIGFIKKKTSSLLWCYHFKSCYNPHYCYIDHPEEISWRMNKNKYYEVDLTSVRSSSTYTPHTLLSWKSPTGTETMLDCFIFSFFGLFIFPKIIIIHINSHLSCVSPRFQTPCLTWQE